MRKLAGAGEQRELAARQRAAAAPLPTGAATLRSGCCSGVCSACSLPAGRFLPARRWSSPAVSSCSPGPPPSSAGALPRPSASRSRTRSKSVASSSNARAVELEIAQAETVQRLSMAVEFRDEDTGAHIERIGRFSVMLARHIDIGHRGSARAAQARRAAARRRQGCDPRRDPAEARTAHARGARDRRDARRGGPPPRARLILVDPRPRGDDCSQPPGEVGRQRLPARTEGRGDPDRGPHRRRRRRLRRTHQRPRLPQGLLRRRGDRDDARTARPPLRPGAARRVHGSARQDRRRLARGAALGPRRARRERAPAFATALDRATRRWPRAPSRPPSRTASRRRRCTPR